MKNTQKWATPANLIIGAPSHTHHMRASRGKQYIRWLAGISFLINHGEIQIGRGKGLEEESGCVEESTLGFLPGERPRETWPQPRQGHDRSSPAGARDDSPAASPSTHSSLVCIVQHRAQQVYGQQTTLKK